MERKTYSINFRAMVTLAGEIQINASNEEEAQSNAMQIIKRNLNVEDCNIELGTENNNDDIITVKEIIPSVSAFNIYNVMPLN